jgi:site-specific DNA-methyltransferase (adenine-specific)
MKPYYQDECVTLYHGDCRDILADLPVADLLLTDPPYNIPQRAAVVRRNTTTIEHWGSAGHNVAVQEWRPLVQLAGDAWIVDFGLQANDGCALARAHEAVCWVPTNFYALIKEAPPPTPRPGFCSALEIAVVSRVGKPKWYGSGYVPNRWSGLTPNRRNAADHPTQKPIEPMRALIRALSPVGAIVLDPFVGSGTTLRAAKDECRKAIGVEIEERYCELAARRLDQGVLDFSEAQMSRHPGVNAARTTTRRTPTTRPPFPGGVPAPGCHPKPKER